MNSLNRLQVQRVLGWLFLVVAVLVCFAQTSGLLAANPPPELRRFAHNFAIRSSIECYGFAVAAMIVGFFVLRSRVRFWLWAALTVATVGLWLFVGRELWNHFVVLPRMRPDFLARYSYFNFDKAPLYLSLPRLAWHILMPLTVVLSTLVIVRGHTIDEGSEVNEGT
jgi:drug/metabolite transporter (DMT)-like permease